MSMQPEDRIHLVHMRVASVSIQHFVDGKTRTDLTHHEMLQFALVRALEIIGEAAACVSESTRRAAPEIPWREAIGFSDHCHLHGGAMYS